MIVEYFRTFCLWHIFLLINNNKLSPIKKYYDKFVLWRYEKTISFVRDVKSSCIDLRGYFIVMF